MHEEFDEELDDMTDVPETSIGDNNAELDDLYASFNNRFPISKLKNLPLEEYTNLAEKSEDYFCYWLEFKLDRLGSIHTFATQFGVSRKKPSKEDPKEGYRWTSKYGENYEEAFANIRSKLVIVAQAAQKESIDWEAIDGCDLPLMLKWKTAFLYSRKRIIPIYAEPSLRYLALIKGMYVGKKTTISEIQRFLIGQQTSNSTIWDTARELWGVWEKRTTEPYGDFDETLWVKLLNNTDIFYEESISVIKKFLDIDGEISFINLAKKMGGTDDHYRQICAKLAGRISRLLVLDVDKDAKGTEKRLKILFDESKPNLSGNALWTLKPNLKIALKKMDLSIKGTFWYVGTQIGDINLETFIKESYWEGGNVKKADVMKNIGSVKKGHIFIAREHGYKGKGKKIAFVRPLAVGIVQEDIRSLGKDWYACNVQWLKINNTIDFTGKAYKHFWSTMDPCSEMDVKRYVSRFLKERMPEAVMDKELREETSLLKLKNNIILQGAPGTGKTYKTAELALSICDGAVPGNHKDVMTRYDELVKQGRIGFVTFHQSMDYEDFVEGIKPKTTEKGVVYEIEDGIFKTMCKNAEKIENKQINSGEIDFSKTRIFKMSLGEKGRNDVEIFDFCFDNKVIALGWGDDKDFSECKERADFRKKDSSWGAFAVEIFKKWMQIGDIVLIADGTKAVRAIAQIEGDYEYHNDYPINMCQYRKVKWLYTGESIPISKLYDKNLSQQTIYAFGSRDKKGNVENGSIKLDVLNDIITGKVEKTPTQNYVLIIDEINRGNVSKIFGELITLLETDKRSDANHHISVILPYTKVPFSVPSNLYIIGTMNTTDRSVGSIDYAVRRRFGFYTLTAQKSVLEEYYKEDKVLKSEAITRFEKVWEFLNNKNNRSNDMEFEDLMVGHSYFMADTLDELNLKWKYEVIPLLKEYQKDGLLRHSIDIENVLKVEKQEAEA